MTVKNYQQILMRRLKVQGFICVDHIGDIQKAIGELVGYVQAGKMKFNEDIQEVPIDDYPKIVCKLYSGENSGKLMMKIAAE